MLFFKDTSTTRTRINNFVVYLGNVGTELFFSGVGYAFGNSPGWVASDGSISDGLRQNDCLLISNFNRNSKNCRWNTYFYTKSSDCFFFQSIYSSERPHRG